VTFASGKGAAERGELKRAPRQKLTEAVAQQLIELVATMKPDERVPSERDMTKSLGVGRSTVREALNGLARMGLVEIRQGQGVFVLAPKAGDDMAEPLQRALMNGVTQEFLEARGVVEVEVARLAAVRRTTADLRRIEEAIEALEDAREAPTEDAVGPAAEFNQAIADAAHNEILASVEESFVALMLERAPELYDIPEFRDWDVAEHRRIFAAIEAGDPELSADLVRKHIIGLGEHYEQVGTGEPSGSARRTTPAAGG
jgi:DNA-binding FadR family transcriptional regulator